MGPQDDPAAFLNIFERVAVSAQWPKDQWALIVTPYLTGLPQEIVDTLDPEDAGDYEKVKTAILNTLNLNEEAYRRRFRELRLKPGIHPRTVAQKMRVNATRWVQPKGKTAEQVLELMILEQLVSTLNSGPRNWVVKHKPTSVEGAVTLLEDYLGAEDPWSNRPATGGEKPRSKDKMAEAVNAGAPRGTPMTTPKKQGPDRVEYVNPTGSRIPRPTITTDPAKSKLAPTWNQGKEKMTACFGCGQFGHIRKFCPAEEYAWANIYANAAKGPWARSEEERAALSDGGVCEAPKVEAMVGVPLLLKNSSQTQTSPPPSPPRREEKGVETPDWGAECGGSLTLNKGVDTRDLEEDLKGLRIARETGRFQAGKRGEEIEAGMGDIRGRPRDIPGGWEWVWMEDPWTHKWEQVRVPHEEAERRRQLD
uniref:CCHC-type domain-containing protein n=1 Tax=Pogona vitticeps TaxID=103695 RepID=A0ABM5GNU4_9SAUR